MLDYAFEENTRRDMMTLWPIMFTAIVVVMALLLRSPGGSVEVEVFSGSEWVSRYDPESSEGATASERAGALLDAGADVLVIDTSHGHSKNVIDAVRELKSEFPAMDLIAGAPVARRVDSGARIARGP